MFEKVKEVILDTLSCEPEQITMEASLVDDLEADSLDAVELNLALAAENRSLEEVFLALTEKTPEQNTPAEGEEN